MAAGIVVGSVVASWLYGGFRLSWAPVLFRVDEISLGAVVPVAAAGGLAVCIAAERDRRAGMWLDSVPLGRAWRPVTWIGAAAPFVVPAAILMSGMLLSASRSPHAAGSPRPLVLALGLSIVALFGTCAALISAFLPLRASSTLLVVMGLGVFMVGQGPSALQRWSPWRAGESNVTLAWVANAGPSPVGQLLAVVSLSGVLLVAACVLCAERPSRFRRTIGLAAMGSVSILVVAAGSQATSVDAAKLSRVLEGGSSTECAILDDVEVCTLPGWREWRPTLASQVSEVLAVVDLPPALPRPVVVQTGVFDPAGSPTHDMPRLVERLRADAINVGFNGPDSDVRQNAVAWIAGLPTVPQTGWRPIPASIRCHNDDRAAVALWILAQLDPAVDQRLVAFEPGADVGSVFEQSVILTAAVEVGPHAVAMAHQLRSMPTSQAADLIARMLPDIRQGRQALEAGLAGSSHAVPRPAPDTELVRDCA